MKTPCSGFLGEKQVNRTALIRRGGCTVCILSFLLGSSMAAGGGLAEDFAVLRP